MPEHAGDERAEDREDVVDDQDDQADHREAVATETRPDDLARGFGRR